MLLSDPDLGAQGYTITRRVGQWQGGRQNVVNEDNIRAIGIIQPPSPEELSFFPEGERRKGTIAIYTRAHLHLSEGEDISDDITWRGERYKLIRIDRWEDYGYCIGYAVKR